MPSSTRVHELSCLSNGGPLSPVTIFGFNRTIGRGEGLAIFTGLKGFCFKRRLWRIARCCIASQLILLDWKVQRFDGLSQVCSNLLVGPSGCVGGSFMLLFGWVFDDPCLSWMRPIPVDWLPPTRVSILF
eukprot:Gb_08753 [translate_table: standard]